MNGTQIKTINEIFGEEYLDKFRVLFRETLFEPAWEALKVNRCPLCGNKLKFPQSKKIAYCSGRKHKKSFVINLERLQEIKNIYV